MAKNLFHIETYTMPVGCTTWITTNHFPHQEDEEKVYSIWQNMARDVKKAYPMARVRHSMRRRSIAEAFNDRESSICSREWLISPKQGKYRITMYVTMN